MDAKDIQIQNLTDKLVEKEKFHIRQIQGLLALQLEATEQTFNAIDSVLKKNEVSVREIPHTPTATTRWALKSLRTTIISGIRTIQSSKRYKAEKEQK